MDKRGEIGVCSEVGEIVSYLAERGEKLVPSTVQSLSKESCTSEGDLKTGSPVSGLQVTPPSCALIGLGGALSKQGLPDHVNGLLSRIARLKNIISIVLFLYNMKLCHY